jgi:hypothetical protein
MKCKKGTHKKSKTRCFDKNDKVVMKRPGKCPKSLTKRSKTRCFHKETDEEHPRHQTIRDLPPDVLNRVHLFNMGVETDNRQITANQFANASRLNLQNPTFVRNMVQRMILDNYRGDYPPLLSPDEFKDRIKNMYRKNKLRPIPLTPEEEREVQRLENELNEQLDLSDQMFDNLTEEEIAEMNQFEAHN